MQARARRLIYSDTLAYPETSPFSPQASFLMPPLGPAVLQVIVAPLVVHDTVPAGIAGAFELHAFEEAEPDPDADPTDPPPPPGNAVGNWTGALICPSAGRAAQGYASYVATRDFAVPVRFRVLYYRIPGNGATDYWHRVSVLAWVLPAGQTLP
jgi:hypothetical protein